MSEEKPQGELMIQTMAMPADTNAAGDIFGGWVVSQMDFAAGIAAGQRAHGRVVTIAIDAMKFIRPVRVGDLVCVHTDIEKIGHTSMKIHVEAWVQRDRFGKHEKVTDALFTFVSVDKHGRPVPVPQDVSPAQD
ncbi:MAG: acyl-CoA thioesterase [Hyphomicrobiales bacterium]|nr:acyl-CoA thioesterase [Hyphomicrobiales bacterium]MCP4998396.1 acyl-CoA thioesterase [Hyphomicrobiales bacterium]